jgi:transposase InsO family protein
MDEDDPRLLKALARYQVVSAYTALGPNRGQRRATLEQLASRTWIGPGGQALRVQPDTIRAWVRRYRKGGFDALFDKDRARPGVRALSPALIDIACALKEQVPHRTLDTLIRILEDLGHAERGTVRRSTLHRALQERGLSGRPQPERSATDLDRFEAAAPNDLWQSDMRTGPWLPDPKRPGKVRRSWLYAFIDDHSRHVLDARFSFKGDLPALELCLRRSVQKWGVPRKVYYDNGQVYRAVHMRTICARLDIQAPIFTTVRRPEGHGKIEALNRVLLGFIAEVSATKIQTLDELNEALRAWLALNYEGEVHGETGEAPLARWRTGIDTVRYADEEALRQAFLWSERRTADKAGVFSMFGVRYQVGPELARRRIEIRYDPEALHEVEVWLKGQFVERARPLEVHPWRRPAAPKPKPEQTPDVDGNWLGHLVETHRAQTAPEPDPRAWKREADERREANTIGLLELLRAHLEPAVVDETEVRAWAARFGPVDLDDVERGLRLLLERFPADLHVRIYLDTLNGPEAR